MTLLPALLLLEACVLAAHADDSTIKRACHCTQNIFGQVKNSIESTVEDLLKDVAGIHTKKTAALPCDVTNVCEIYLMDPAGTNTSGYCVNLKNKLRGEDEVAAQACVQIRQETIGLDASGNYDMIKRLDGKATWTEGFKLCKSADYCNAAAKPHAAGIAVATLMLSSILTLF